MNVNVVVNAKQATSGAVSRQRTRTTTTFSFEKLDSYRVAIEFLAESAKLIDSLPRGYGWLSDQLRRASLSQALNIAEAAGRVGPADQRRHYAIARGSGMECAAILSALLVLEVGDKRLIIKGKALLFRSVSMLTKMCR